MINNFENIMIGKPLVSRERQSKFLKGQVSVKGEDNNMDFSSARVISQVARGNVLICAP